MAPVPQYQITTRAVMVALTLSPQQHVTVDRGTHDFVCSGKSITQNLFYRQLSNQTARECYTSATRNQIIVVALYLGKVVRFYLW